MSLRHHSAIMASRESDRILDRRTVSEIVESLNAGEAKQIRARRLFARVLAARDAQISARHEERWAREGDTAC